MRAILLALCVTVIGACAEDPGPAPNPGLWWPDAGPDASPATPTGVGSNGECVFALPDKQGMLTPNVIDGTKDVDIRFAATVIVGGACSGTLIAPNLVLTAAHCVCPNQPGVCTRPVVTVSHNRYSTSDVRVPDYFRLDINPSNFITFVKADLAVLVLADKVAGIEPVALATAPPRIGQTVLMSGFGNSECTAAGMFGTRLYGINSVWQYNADRIELSGTMGHVTWIGDSGGGLYAQFTPDCDWVLVGVNSYGSCGKVSGHTKVAEYYPWLRQVISDYAVP